MNFAPETRDLIEHVLLNFIEPGPYEPTDIAMAKEIQMDEILMGHHHGFPTTDYAGSSTCIFA